MGGAHLGFVSSEEWSSVPSGFSPQARREEEGRKKEAGGDPGGAVVGHTRGAGTRPELGPQLAGRGARGEQSTWEYSGYISSAVLRKGQGTKASNG